MNPYPAAVAKMYRKHASHADNLRLRAACEERARFYETLANETIDEYRVRTERENTKLLRHLTVRFCPEEFESNLQAWFGSGQPGYVMPADLISALSEVVGRHAPSNQYGRIMKRLGFRSVLQRLDGPPQRVWARGPFPSPRYTIQRDATGRVSMCQLAAPAAPPPLPY